MSSGELIILAVLRRMVETGALDMDDINAIADDIEAENADAAHQVRFAGLEGVIGEPESPADHAANIRRRSMRLIEPDGGKRGN
jgi:hypothetical protein